MTVAKKNTKKIVPLHKWTHDGDEVLVVRFSDKDGKSHNGFQHPLAVGEIVTAPDWNTEKECGGGIHGWAWGLGLGEGKECDWSALWQVYAVSPKDIVPLEGKVKFRTGVLRFMGHWADATNFVLAGQRAWVFHSARGSASNSGESGSASNSGWRGSASNSGWRGSASNSGESGSASNSGERGSASNSGWKGSASNSGERGSASNSGERGSASNSGWNGSASNSGWRGSASNSGWRGSASNSGWRGSASNSGWRGSASNSGWNGSASNSGERGSASNSGWNGSASTTTLGTAAVCTGLYGKARAGEFGCIALAWWNKKEERVEMRCALVGFGHPCKADTWYALDEKGNFVEVA